MNYYEPKYLRGVIQKLLPLPVFFRKRFFGENILFPTEKVSFEFATNKRRLLPYASSEQGSVSLKRDGYMLRTYTAPLSAGHRDITEHTLQMKALGELEWNSGVSPDERARMIAAQDLMELQDALYLKEEYMCARVKQDGKLETPYGEVDYGFTNIENTTNANKWNANYDIFGKLREKASALRKSGTNPDMLVLGSGAAGALMSNTGFKEYLKDSPHIVEPEEKTEDGIHYICRINLPGLYLKVYEYDSYYTDNQTGESKPMLDTGTAILQSSQEKNYMLFGSVSYIQDRQLVSAVGEYIPYTVIEERPPAELLTVASRSLPLPRDIESWAVMKNVA